MLDGFSGDIGAFAEFTESDEYRLVGPQSPRELEDFIAFSLVRDAINTKTPVPSHADRTLAALLVEAGISADPGTGSTRSIRWRARRRLETDPSIRRIYTYLLEALGHAA